MQYIRAFVHMIRMRFTVKCTYCGNIYDKDASRYCPKCGKSDWVKY